jgi:23S rRNA (pseudouridine1915-N3)-methyltransferase
MKLTLAVVGRLRPYYRQAADEYLERTRRFWSLDEREVREGGREGNEIAQRRAEGVLLRTALPTGAMIVALDGGGSAWSSEELARRMSRWRDSGKSIGFLIGGAVGLEPSLLADATERWSLGPLTLPHELARVVVLEQLYRAGTILAGQPYHKG